MLIGHVYVMVKKIAQSVHSGSDEFATEAMGLIVIFMMQ